MRYFLFCIFLFSSFTYALERSLSRRQIVATTHSRYTFEPNLSEAEKNLLQIQLDDINTSLIKDLKDCAHPSRIQHNLDAWNDLKTTQINMSTDQINAIIKTAATVEELAQASALSQATALGQAKDSGLRSSTKVIFINTGNDFSLLTQNYINAQLNYDKICNHLGIKKITFMTE